MAQTTDATSVAHVYLKDNELAVFRTNVCERHRTGACFNADRCSNSHCQTWQRRNPMKYFYSPKLCPDIEFVKRGNKMCLIRRCSQGRACMFAHSKEEELYHPTVYKTKICNSFPCCYRFFCPFAHTEHELRNQATPLKLAAKEVSSSLNGFSFSNVSCPASPTSASTTASSIPSSPTFGGAVPASIKTPHGGLYSNIRNGMTDPRGLLEFEFLSKMTTRLENNSLLKEKDNQRETARNGPGAIQNNAKLYSDIMTNLLQGRNSGSTSRDELYFYEVLRSMLSPPSQPSSSSNGLFTAVPTNQLSDPLDSTCSNCNGHYGYSRRNEGRYIIHPFLNGKSLPEPTNLESLPVAPGRRKTSPSLQHLQPPGIFSIETPGTQVTTKASDPIHNVSCTSGMEERSNSSYSDDTDNTLLLLAALSLLSPGTLKDGATSMSNDSSTTEVPTASHKSDKIAVDICELL